MQVPSAGFVEAAQEKLKRQDPDVLADESRELKQAVGEGVGEGFTNGYLLGLETARVMLLGHPLLPLKGVDPESLL